MKFKIGKKLTPEIHKNEYRININFMYGDADGYEDVDIFVSKEEENNELPRFIVFLDNCIKLYESSGRCGYDTYDEVEDYGYFVDECEENESEDPQIILEWPYDPSNGGTKATIEGYTITYFDEDGYEYGVKIIKK